MSPKSKLLWMPNTPASLMMLESPIAIMGNGFNMAYQKQVGLVIITSKGEVPTIDPDILLVKAYNTLQVSPYDNNYTPADHYNRVAIQLKAILSLIAETGSSALGHTDESLSFWNAQRAKYMSRRYPCVSDLDTLTIYKDITVSALHDEATKHAERAFRSLKTFQTIMLLETLYGSHGSMPVMYDSGSYLAREPSWNNLLVHEGFLANAEMVLKEFADEPRNSFRFEIKNIDRSAADFAAFITKTPEMFGKPACWRLWTSMDGESRSVVNESDSISHLVNMVSYIQENGSLDTTPLFNYSSTPGGYTGSMVGPNGLNFPMPVSQPPMFEKAADVPHWHPAFKQRDRRPLPGPRGSSDGLCTRIEEPHEPNTQPPQSMGVLGKFSGSANVGDTTRR